MAGESRIERGRRSFTQFILRIAEGQTAPTRLGLLASHVWKHILLYPDGDLGCDCMGCILSVIEAEDRSKHLRQLPRRHPILVQLINLHIPLRRWLRFRLQPSARLFLIRQEGCQD